MIRYFIGVEGGVRKTQRVHRAAGDDAASERFGPCLRGSVDLHMLCNYMCYAEVIYLLGAVHGRRCKSRGIYSVRQKHFVFQQS